MPCLGIGRELYIAEVEMHVLWSKAIVQTVLLVPVYHETLSWSSILLTRLNGQKEVTYTVRMDNAFGRACSAGGEHDDQGRVEGDLFEVYFGIGRTVDKCFESDANRGQARFRRL